MAHVLTRKAYPKDGALGPWAGEVYVFPTTVAQQGFWFFDRLEPGNPAYNIAVRFRLRGVLRIAKLERAMNEVVRRHESLRTIFTEADGEPVQVVAPALTLPMSLVDLGGLPRRGRFERAEAVAEEEARGRFELTAGPLLRYTLVRLDPNDHVLLLTVHHIVADGWSIGLIAHELGTHYDAYDRGVEPAPTPLPLQYGDFAAWQKLWLGHGDLDQKLAYWARTLRGLATLELPTDHPRSAAPTSEGDIVSVLLPVGLTETLKALCHSRGVTLFMLTLAALKVILRRRIGQDDVFVGTLIAGRSKTELEPLIGPFINCLVLRTDLSGDPTFLELLDRVRETVLQAITHGEVPFERVVEAVQPKRDPSRHPLFQINFIFQRDFVRPFHAANLTLTAMPSKSPGAIYDLNVFMVEREEGWRASCEYNTGLYEASTVQTLLELFESLLHDLAADPSRPISRYAIANADRPVPGGLTARRPENPAAPVSLQATDGADVEGALMGLWERTLGGGPVGLDDDFFDFGGHSLLAMRLLAQIESTFGKRVALAIFLQAPTVKAVAARLREEATRSRLDQTIVLQAKGRGVPFVLVDTGPYFRTLVRRMGDAHPVYGLILPELPDLPPRFTVADIAANLIEALRAVQPHGPYQLGGWCHAGLIAVEMARLLRARGERVDLIVLFDTDSPRYVRRFRGPAALPARLYFKCERLIYHLGNLRRLGPREWGGYLNVRFETFKDACIKTYWRIFYRGMNRAPGENLRHASGFQYLAVESYDPEPTEVPVVLFRSQFLQTGLFRDPELGWGEIARGGLVVHEVPGNHRAIFDEPGVGLLADALIGHLKNQAPPSPSSFNGRGRVTS